MTDKRSDEYKPDAGVINAPVIFHDSKGYRITGITLMGKLHNHLHQRLVRRASELPGNDPLQTKLKRYVEGLLDGY